MSERSEYWDDVETIADEILEEHFGDDNAITEAVTEHVDSSSWIIYTGNQLTVLDATHNDPDGREVAAMSDGSWQGMQTIAAFLAMEGDVHECIHSKIDDADTECPDCEGNGTIDCEGCSGYGEVDCPKCEGEGCDSCDNKGVVECEDCEGEASFECERCEGAGEINPFKEVR